MMSPQVTVAQGAIKGEQRTAFDGTKYFSFEGIPYAKPPVGNLRFRDPQPPDFWSGVRDCTKLSDKCAQINPTTRKGFEGSEDCLYLNIYTPHLPPGKLQKLPILFFIHGGRLTFGYGGYYQPDYFLRHDVIIVTFNYRLNILGFLSLDTPEVPGNAGLKDCVAALRWVKSNIESFNGDPNNITIFGESAGGAICTAFLCSKMTAGLFHKMINQSGNDIGDVFMCQHDHVEEARRVAGTLGKDIKDKKELHDFFLSLPVQDLVQAYLMTGNKRLLNPLLMAVVEKEFPNVECFMHEMPIESFRNNRFIKVPTISGSNMYEGAAFVFKDKKGIRYPKDMKKFVPHYLYLNENDPKFLKIANSIKEYYFKDKSVGDETLIEYIRMLSDAFFNRDITHSSELIAKNNDEFYSYKFKYVGNMSNGIMNNLGVYGTTHGDSVQYQFYRKKLAEKATEEDMAIVDFFSEVFTNFAKHGKPTWSKQKLEWVPYTPEKKLTLVIDKNMSLVRNEDWECFQFWQSLCGERCKL